MEAEPDALISCVASGGSENFYNHLDQNGAGTVPNTRYIRRDLI